MTLWTEVDRRLSALLSLDAPAVAVSFVAAPPAGVRRFLGVAPSSCSFWSVAAGAPAEKSAFYTLPADHYNCPVGAYTHNVDLPADRAHELPDVLGVMASLGYLNMDEVPAIPRWRASPGAIVYARLAEAPVAPDVVVLSVRPHAAMLLGEAARAEGASAGIEPLPRPTCMALPAAAAHGTTLSLGCVGNRVYTGLPDTHVYTVVRGEDLEKIATRLEIIANANEQLRAYHQERSARLRQ